MNEVLPEEEMGVIIGPAIHTRQCHIATDSGLVVVVVTGAKPPTPTPTPCRLLAGIGQCRHC